jgi:hypothetical protein
MTIRFRNANQFRRELRKFGQTDVPEEQRILQQRIGLDLLRRIIFRTAVKTGRARGNWQVALGSAGSGSQLELFDTDGNPTLATGAGVIASAPPFSLITLFNNVKYIRKLEAGGSRQHPQGMVAVSLAEVDSQFR